MKLRISGFSVTLFSSGLLCLTPVHAADVTLVTRETDQGYQSPSSVLESQVEQTKDTVRALSDAIDNFELDVMRYPTEQEGLKALLTNPGLKDWYGPYVKEEDEIIDAWGTPLKYQSPTGSEYRIISVGPDKEFGTKDDVGVDD